MRQSEPCKLTGDDMTGQLFTIECKDEATGARAGVLHLPHGDVKTPVFMPVGTKGCVKAANKEELEELGFNLILANTYHLHLRPGEQLVKDAGGLHGFTGWRGNFLTDSGGFQAWSLSRIRKLTEEGIAFQSIIDGSRHLFTPEGVVRMQAMFSSDIQMQLDVCTGWGAAREEAERAVSLTSSWASRALAEWRRQQGEGYQGELFPIVQGNFFDDLRTQSADLVNSLGTQGVAIGGLSVGESADVFRQTLSLVMRRLDERKVRYVMGVGTPEYILEACGFGVDMFDCVLPTRLARHGVYLHRRGRLSVKQKRFERDFTPIDERCGCKVCQTYSRAYLRHLFRENEILSAMLATYHNLYFMHAMMDAARSSIEAGTFGVWRENFLREFQSGAF